MSLIPFLHQVAARRDLTAPDAQAAMGIILAGEASPAQIAAFHLLPKRAASGLSFIVRRQCGA